MHTKPFCLLSALAACLGVLLLSLPSAHAIPYFARKYGFECAMCHSNFPRLNDFGLRYRDNGYSLPGASNREREVERTTAPFAARVTAGYFYDKFENTPDAEEVNHFRINSLDILSGGLLTERIGYLLVWPPKLEESSGVAPQPGTVEMGNVVFRLRESPLARSTLRVGRLEPAYLAFSVARRLSFSSYEVYDFTFPGGPALSDTMDGIEFAGRSAAGFRYAAGCLNGSETNELDDPPEDFYVRAAKVFGQGEGQTAGQRIGFEGVFGQARPLTGGGREPFNRLGLDGSFNWLRWNLDVQYLRGQDDGALWGLPSDEDWSGGFVQGLFMPSTKLVGFARYDWVSTPSAIDLDTTRWVIGGRFYFEDEIALHLEYSHRRQDSPLNGDETENFATAALDYAF